MVGDGGPHYHNAMSEIHRELRRPHVQRKIFSFAQTTPTDLVRSKLSTSEIQSRALSSLPDELLENLPEDTSSYSLFQGFQASIPEENDHRKSHRRRSSRTHKLLKEEDAKNALPATFSGMKKERESLNHRLEMMGIRKNMSSAEIHEIDNKIANLNSMRKIVLDRLAGLEMDEAELEHECGFFYCHVNHWIRVADSYGQWWSWIISLGIWRSRIQRTKQPPPTRMKIQWVLKTRP